MNIREGINSRLFFAFWVVGVLPALLFAAAIYYSIELASYFQLGMPSTYYFYIFLAIAPLLYFPFAIKHIIKIAKLSGTTAWSTLAVYLSIIAFGIYVATFFYFLLIPPSVSTKYAGGRYTYISIVTKYMRFQGKSERDITKLTKEDIEKLKSRDENIIIPELCNDSSTHNLLADNYSIIYEYYDKNEAFLYGFKVTKDSCKKG